MREAKGDLWEYPDAVKCITTNGFVKTNGEAVMGRGCALEAKRKFPGIDKVLGDLIKENGNVVNLLNWEYYDQTGQHLSCILFSFPVKHNWYEKADINLIKQSSEQIANIAAGKDWHSWEDLAKEWNGVSLPHIPIVIPRPGCGNGGLTWEEVKPVIEPILDDRFVIISW